MTRYTPEHREQTRARILRHAAELFRKHGYSGVGIDTVMAAAGLTRGGFYGYFRSKADLFRQVMGGEHDFIRRLDARQASERAERLEGTVEVIGGYLDPANLQGVRRGCAFVSVAADVARSGKPVRREFEAMLRDFVTKLGDGLEGADDDELDERALAAAAVAVGAVNLAQALDDRRLIERLLGAALREAERILRSPPASVDAEQQRPARKRATS
jgi:TetR/AcrR family transcriptional repressor of nem operon